MICSLSIVVLPGTVSYFVFVLFAFEKVVVLPALRVHSETTASGQQIPPPPPTAFPQMIQGGGLSMSHTRQLIIRNSSQGWPWLPSHAHVGTTSTKVIQLPFSGSLGTGLPDHRCWAGCCLLLKKSKQRRKVSPHERVCKSRVSRIEL